MISPFKLPCQALYIFPNDIPIQTSMANTFFFFQCYPPSSCHAEAYTSISK
jgi:hypothetical protein